MQNFPHHYTVTAVGSHGEDVELRSEGLRPLRTTTPPEFDGPGGRWSPETLLVAAIGDCLALTFRGVARKSGLAWTSFESDVTGTLDRVEGTVRFVAFEIHARIQLPAGARPELARRVLEIAERNCLITNSLNGSVRVVPSIEVEAPVLSIEVPARLVEHEPAA